MRKQRIRDDSLWGAFAFSPAFGAFASINGADERFPYLGNTALPYRESSAGRFSGFSGSWHSANTTTTAKTRTGTLVSMVDSEQ